MYIFPFLFFLPLVSDPKTAYGKFHANNALLILFMYVIASILVWTFIIPAVLWTAAFVYQILGIISAVKGSTKPLPLIGSLVLIK
ncbi:hypothetical protein SDC9_200181 [bioreactor metagenome]|uniref:Uncharacterized protein n=1 Tax=bioreactor metagenome TaxID=1076179 RepID=A0A645IQB3_9ZZZZ